MQVAASQAPLGADKMWGDFPIVKACLGDEAEVTCCEMDIKHV